MNINKFDKEIIKDNKNIRIVDIPIDNCYYKLTIGCISYTILMLIWVFSIFIPIALIYWIYIGNWNLFVIFFTLLIVPIIFKLNDHIPYIIKKFCNLLIRDIHHWTGPGRIIIEDPDFDINTKQLLCLHPHGILGIGSIYLNMSGIFSKLHLIVTESLVWLQPIISIILNSTVKLRGASHLSFKNTMKREEGPLMMFPGGFHETILLNWGIDHIYAKKRFGFIKYCLKYNYSIRPVYVFGECLSFHQFQHFKKLRWFLNDYSLPSVVFCGETWWNPLLPIRNVPYLIIIGEAIKPTESLSSTDQSNPSRELIKKYQSLYINSLKRIYRQYSSYYVNLFKDNPMIYRYNKNKLEDLKID